ncbi:MAG: Holliday junction resolvase RuvX [Candidatus Symbiodolus clandestinus]
MAELLLAFDFGLRQIGVAIGSRLTQARPLTALVAQRGCPNWQKLSKLVENWQPKLLVVGLPLNMDGSEQPITQAARQFGVELQQRFALPVNLQDERLSTVEAKAHLFKQGGYRALKKTQIDALSATLILESWLATINPLANNP